MTVIILKYAIKQLLEMKNPSFYIMEDANRAIVDFAESEEEVNHKCMKALSHGIKCTYYESSVKTFDSIRDATKNVDLDPTKGDSIIIPNMDLREVSE